MDSFVTVQFSTPPPDPVVSSQEIRDRGSLFSATIYRAASQKNVQATIKYHKHVYHCSKPATHEIAAWRLMVLKDGKTGLSGPEDFELVGAYNDDGERWAGMRVLKIMQSLGVIDAVVIVSRWYGGEMLGPARFDHIEVCARDVCVGFKRKEEIDECIASLQTLDDVLADLRAELAQLTKLRVEKELGGEASTEPGPSTTKAAPSKKPDYSKIVLDVDLSKARRLLTAREHAIKAVRSMIAKRKMETQPAGENKHHVDK